MGVYMTKEEDMIKCSMCEAVIEDVYLIPDLIARFYKWTGTISNRNGISYKYCYCPKHSISKLKTLKKSDQNEKYTIRNIFGISIDDIRQCY